MASGWSSICPRIFSIARPKGRVIDARFLTEAEVREQGRSGWTARALTLFPEMFPGPLGSSLAGKALEKGIWRLETLDIRSFALDKHRSVDDTPFGGGPGMVMRPDVIDAALASAGADGLKPAIYLTPRGRLLSQGLVRELAQGPGVVLLCGRYEGLDERVIEARKLMEVSLGDFVLSGGEPAAMALIDACVRLLPGVVGAEETLAEESFEQGLLEYPHYTRPVEWNGRTVPEVLMSGHHEKIKAWRLAMAEETTKTRRPDLWEAYVKRGAARAVPKK
jgi:tRNA (guanine37-N1)-methyltransferase